MRLAFKQVILPGQQGRDVRAVKIAYGRIGVHGSGTLGKSNRAGPAFVHVTKHFQLNHGLHVDGKYGAATHKKLVASKRDGKMAFGTYAARLYRSAKKRPIPPRPPSPPPNLSAAEAAKYILVERARGNFRTDNPGDLRDLEATAAGKAVWSQGGYWVHIDRRPLDAIAWLLKNGHKVGTFALCSDHHYDGPHGHAGGLAVDISFFDGEEIGWSNARSDTLRLAKLLHDVQGQEHPWQEITGGYGGRLDAEIYAESIPGFAFYGYATMVQHTNHVHLGYYR